MRTSVIKRSIGHSGTNKSDWIRLYASISYETKTRLKLLAKHYVSIYIKIYLQSFASIIIFIIYLQPSTKVFLQIFYKKYFFNFTTKNDNNNKKTKSKRN